MLFEISLDDVVTNELGSLMLFNNNILETKQCRLWRQESQAGFSRGLCDSKGHVLGGHTLTILTVPRSSPPPGL